MCSSFTPRVSPSARNIVRQDLPRPPQKSLRSRLDEHDTELENAMRTRTLQHIIESIPTSDGAGVKLRRSLGSQRGVHVDPFLMLDEFYSDNPNAYIAGFPSHPHRGFET